MINHQTRIHENVVDEFGARCNTIIHNASLYKADLEYIGEISNMKMNGQWLGNASATTTDTTNYLCMLNLDLKDESYEGRVLLFYLPFQRVSSVAHVKINKNDFDSALSG